MLVEHEYERCGAWAYIAGLDVYRMKLFGQCEHQTGIAPFDRFVESVMRQSPYREARRLFWIVDNGLSHRGYRCNERYSKTHPNLTIVHGPVHASWLNQIEIYFSVLQRKALKPNDFQSLEELQDRILSFQTHYESIAKPFKWTFTRHDLVRLVKKLRRQPMRTAA